jgi:hypothetical protein
MVDVTIPPPIGAAIGFITSEPIPLSSRAIPTIWRFACAQHQARAQSSSQLVLVNND